MVIPQRLAKSRPHAALPSNPIWPGMWRILSRTPTGKEKLPIRHTDRHPQFVQQCDCQSGAIGVRPATGIVSPSGTIKPVVEAALPSL